MATTTQLAVPTRTANPLALWHLLSLDAPTVAALWVWFIARACQVRLPAVAPLAMAVAVWMLYATDRLLDARVLNAPGCAPDELEARHLFHHQYRRAFLAGIGLGMVALGALLPGLNPLALRLYLVEGALLAAWFFVLHASDSAHHLPKEIAVGMFFAAATFIPTVGREADAPGIHTALLPCAFLFAALCSLNCLFIYAWEHDCGDASARQAHATTRLALRHLFELAVVVMLAGIASAIVASSTLRVIPAACALSAAALLALDRNRRSISRTTLRAAADAALLTPVLLLPFLR